MILKIFILDVYLDLSEKLGALSDKHGVRFHQYNSITDKRIREIRIQICLLTTELMVKYIYYL